MTKDSDPIATPLMTEPSAEPRSVGYFSPGIGKLPHLSVYLQAPCQRVLPWNRQSLSHICGWGHKPTADKARRYATRHQLPYIALEDGFIRSLALGVNGGLPLSLIIDHRGIYYDAGHTSDLEQLIANGVFSEQEYQEAQACIALIQTYRLSKYNHAPDQLPTELLKQLDNDKPKVLVVDQTAGDMSVTLGQADENSFRTMLESAIDQHPKAQILVKVHPDVLAGKKSSYLIDLARTRNCVLVACDISPWTLLDQVSDVYVVTSQMGFEALLAGKRVHTFGMPFYAGWGLTDDRLSCPRREHLRGLSPRPITLLSLFIAAYLRYCRYVNPYTGQPSDLRSTLELLYDQRRMVQISRGAWTVLDMSSWKQAFLPSFLGREAHIVFARSSNWSERMVSAASTASSTEGIRSTPNLLVWASKADQAVIQQANTLGCRLWRMEDGFIRSVGLGVDLVAPLSLVLDTRGIYFDATAPSDLECLLNDYPFDEKLLKRAAGLRQQLIQYRLSKYNVGGSEPLSLPLGKRTLLVPGQVESDASIRLGSPEIKTNQALLQRVRQQNPDAFIIYKPHPDVVGGGRLGGHGDAACYDRCVEQIPMPDLLEQVDEVHTLSSLTGFEALLRGVKVHTYGLPFYAGWGLTQDQLSCERRQRQLNLDELVAATLILYPRYCDPQTGDLINAETAVELLRQQKERPKPLSLRSQVYRRIRKAY